MMSIRTWIKASVGTWALLIVVIGISSFAYATIAEGVNERDALVLSSLIGIVMLVSARLVQPPVIDPCSWQMRASALADDLRDLLKRHGAHGIANESLHAALRALDLEGVTNYHFTDPVGRSALLMRVTFNASHPVVIGELLPYLGSDPLTIRTIVLVGDDSVVLATFARDISQQALDVARSVTDFAKISRISVEDAAMLLKLDQVQAAKVVAAA